MRLERSLLVKRAPPSFFEEFFKVIKILIRNLLSIPKQHIPNAIDSTGTAILVGEKSHIAPRRAEIFFNFLIGPVSGNNVIIESLPFIDASGKARSYNCAFGSLSIQPFLATML